MIKLRFISQIAIFCLMISHQIVIADDTEIFLGGNTNPPDPKVLFIFDNSGSMDGSVTGSSYTRMSVAKKALLEIIHEPDNASLDIGLMLFNYNISSDTDSSDDGGRVVFAIQDIPDANIRGNSSYSFDPTGDPPDEVDGDADGNCASPGATGSLTERICNIISHTWTPLEETLYETYLYYKGTTPMFGNEHNELGLTGPVEDALARNGTSTYYSPIFENFSLLNDITGDGNKDINDLQCETGFVVLMTDGSPTNDKAAHIAINGLDSNCSTSSGSGLCMDDLSKYMYENDLDNDSSNDKQRIVTYTVAFGGFASVDDVPDILKTTATNGGGEFFYAANADELTQSFNTIFSSINNSLTSFTSPGTGSSVANDARSLNYVYNAVFQPEDSPKWSGNLKKYRFDLVVTGQDADANDILEFKVVDVNGAIVYDDSGNIVSVANGGTYDVQSIWSDSADTDKVELGGASSEIPAYSSRTVYTISDTDSDSSTQDEFTLFKNTTPANAFLTPHLFVPQSTYEGLDADLTTAIGLYNADTTNVTMMTDLIDWARGKDTEDENGDTSTIDTRWIMGDPLHSKPIIINYGRRNNESPYAGDFSDIRIAIGTNAGFLHLFEDDLGGSGNTSSGGHTTGDVVAETWAFIPTELLPNLQTLQSNAVSSSHPYGLDSSVSLFIDDKNQDGNICSQTQDCNADTKSDGDLNGDGDTADDGEDDDQVIIVFGMRRGGAYYYAIDVTDPDVPLFLWKKTHTNIEQSWSEVQFGKVKYFEKSSSTVQTKTVAIFTAGYDSDKDTDRTIGSNDDKGNALYMHDLYTGELIWSVVDGGGTSDKETLYESSLDNSFPATPKAVDIDDDGILDRIYLADTGGHVWRIDLFNQDAATAYATSPVPTYATRDTLYTNDSRESWSIFKLANLGRNDVNDLTNDRRFFNQIDFVQTRDDNGNFDAIILGSGHRNNPNETDTTNRFYMLRDTAVFAYKYQSGDCETDNTLTTYDAHCQKNPSIVVNDDLRDVTTSAPNSYTTSGWRLDLTTSGEKNLGSSVTINGTIFFTTFSPTINLSSSCSPQGGSSFIYAVDLHTARASVDFDESGSIDEITDRKKSSAQSGIPETPPIIIPPGGDDIYVVPGNEPIWAGTASTKVHYWFNKCE